MSTERRCATHGRRPGTVVCVSCDRPMCHGCAVSTSVGYKCGGCAGRQPSWSRWWTSAAGVVVVFGLLAGSIWWFAVGGRGEPAAAPPDGAAVRTVDVRFEAADGFELAGSLDLPAGEDGAGRRPAVAILSGGADATDRVGYGLPGGGTDPLYAELGRRLAEAGFVVLRFDKRGAGVSRPLPDGGTLTFDHRLFDATAAIEFLRDRPDVDPGSVAVVGHAEGGVVAMRLAARATDLAGVVLVSTWGRPMYEALVQEYRAQGDGAHMRAADELEQAMQVLAETGEVPDVGPMVQPIFSGQHPEYLRGLLTFDPVSVADDVTAPVLIVHGERDPVVRTGEDIRQLGASLVRSARVDLVEVPDAGHTLRVVDRPDAGSAEGHGGDAPPGIGRAPGVWDEIAGWLQARVAEDGA